MGTLASLSIVTGIGGLPSGKQRLLYLPNLTELGSASTFSRDIFFGQFTGFWAPPTPHSGVPGWSPLGILALVRQLRE
jgi:hypothetical protein